MLRAEPSPRRPQPPTVSRRRRRLAPLLALGLFCALLGSRLVNPAAAYTDYEVLRGLQYTCDWLTYMCSAPIPATTVVPGDRCQRERIEVTIEATVDGLPDGSILPYIELSGLREVGARAINGAEMTVRADIAAGDTVSLSFRFPVDYTWGTSEQFAARVTRVRRVQPTPWEEGPPSGPPPDACWSCRAGAVAPSSDFMGIRLPISLGVSTNGVGAGDLILEATAPAASNVTPAALRYRGDASQVDLVRDGDFIYQIRSPEILAEVTSSNNSSFDVSLYAGTNITGQSSPYTGLQWFACWHIESVGGDTNLNAIRVTESRRSGTNEPTVRLTTYDWLDGDTNQFVTTFGTGSVQRVVTQARTNLDSSTWTVTRTVSGNPGNTPAYKERCSYLHEETLHSDVLTERIVDPDNLSLTDRWVYASSSSGSGFCTQWISRTGYWEAYAHDANNRLSTIIMQHLGNPPSTEPAECRVVTIGFAPPTTSGDYAISTAESRCGVPTAASETAWNGEHTHRQDTVFLDSTAHPTNALVESTQFDGQGRIAWVRYADGTALINDYQTNGLLCSLWQFRGAPNNTSGDPVAGTGTVSRTDFDILGRITNVTIRACPQTNIVISGWTVLHSDDLGRPTEIVYNDGTSELLSYGCCGLTSKTDRRGLVTAFGYDDFDRPNGLTTPQDGPTLEYDLDAAGRVLSAVLKPPTANGAVPPITNALYRYDLAGRMTQAVDAVGNATSLAETVGDGLVVRTATFADGGTAILRTYADGLPHSLTGTAVHAVSYTNGATAGGTWTRAARIGAGGASSEWEEIWADSAGRPYRILYPDGTSVSNAFNARGEVASVTTAGGKATINRSQAGEVQGAQFDDGKTPSRGVEFDRAGRLIGDGFDGGVSNSYTLSADGRVTTNTVLGAGAVADHRWDFSYDAESEALSSATLVRGGSTRTIAWGHDAEPKVTSVTDAGTVGVAYGWIEAVPGVGSAAVVVNGVTNPVVLTRKWNVQRGAVTGVSYQAGASVLASFRYSHPTNGTRASRLTLGDGSYWEYGYDGAGRLTNAVRKTDAGVPIPGFSFRYAFDGAGNSVAAGPATPAGALWNFEAAGSQFHVRRVWSNLVEIVGQAASDAVVSVRTDAGIVRAERNGLWFAARVPVRNENAAVHTAITVAAVRNDGTNDLVQETRGRLFVPKLDEAVTNSAAGAILNDSRWTFTWDWYRRLIAAESSGRTPELKLDFTYDPEGRRVRKQVSEKSGGNWVLVRTHRFTNLGWRPVEEEIVTTSNTVVREYVWGLDLSGTPEGAGGIGGLVAIRQGGTVLLPLCDAMGNVRHLVDGQGAVVASYDFDPFGRLIARSGAAADACPFLFSTKYLDEETGFYYFGYRYYDPCSLKWLCRDPLGEAAGPNLTAFCRNDPVNNVDPLGLEPILCHDPITGKAGYFDSYDIFYLGWEGAVNEGQTVDRGLAMTWQIPLGDMPLDALQGESFRMRAGPGMANALNALGMIAPVGVVAGLGMIPGAGEGQDVLVLFAKNSTVLDRILSGGSLALSMVTLGFSPNYGAPARAGREVIANSARVAGDVGQQFGRAVDDFAEMGRRGGTLYSPEKLAQLQRYLARRNVKLVLAADEFLDAEKAAGLFRGFENERAILYLKSNATVYEVKHELSHFVDFRWAGFERYSSVSRTVREQSVYNRLRMNRSWRSFSEAEQGHAFMYILKVGGNPLEIPEKGLKGF